MGEAINLVENFKVEKVIFNCSVISVGKNNRYGHPNKEVINNLNNSKIYRTDEDGSIMFKIKSDKLNIETSKQKKYVNFCHSYYN